MEVRKVSGRKLTTEHRPLILVRGFAEVGAVEAAVAGGGALTATDVASLDEVEGRLGRDLVEADARLGVAAAVEGALDFDAVLGGAGVRRRRARGVFARREDARARSRPPRCSRSRRTRGRGRGLRRCPRRGGDTRAGRGWWRRRPTRPRSRRRRAPGRRRRSARPRAGPGARARARRWRSERSRSPATRCTGRSVS